MKTYSIDRFKYVLACVAVLVTAVFSFVFFINPSNSGVSVNKNVVTHIPTPTPIPTLNPSDVLKAINNYRVDMGMQYVSETYELCTIARSRADDLDKSGVAENPNLTHTGFQRFADMYSGQLLGENLANESALSELSGEFVLNVWLGSPSHKELLDKPKFTEGCVANQGKIIVLLMGQP